MENSVVVNFKDEYGKVDTLRVGSRIVAWTGSPYDVYGPDDDRVLNGEKKVGDHKDRYGRVLLVESPVSIIVQFVSTKDRLQTNWNVELSNGKVIESRNFYLKRIQASFIHKQKPSNSDLNESDLKLLVQTITDSTKQNNKLVNILKNAYSIS